MTATSRPRVSRRPREPRPGSVRRLAECPATSGRQSSGRCLAVWKRRLGEGERSHSGGVGARAVGGPTSRLRTSALCAVRSVYQSARGVFSGLCDGLYASPLPIMAARGSHAARFIDTGTGAQGGAPGGKWQSRSSNPAWPDLDGVLSCERGGSASGQAHIHPEAESSECLSGARSCVPAGGGRAGRGVDTAPTGRGEEGRAQDGAWASDLVTLWTAPPSAETETGRGSRHGWRL